MDPSILTSLEKLELEHHGFLTGQPLITLFINELNLEIKLFFSHSLMSNFLSALVNKNKYIHHNSVPKSPFNQPTPSPPPLMSHNNTNSSQNNGNRPRAWAQPFTGPGSVDLSMVVDLCPAVIDLPFIIIKLDGKYKTDRRVPARIECRTDDKSVEAAILLIFKEMKLDDYNVEWFVMGWGQDAKALPEREFGGYDLSKVNWDLRKCLFFTQRQLAPPVVNVAFNQGKNKDSAGKQQNKQDYASQTLQLQDAENRLRKGLGHDLFMKLKSNNRLFIESKFDLGPYNKGWDAVYQNIVNTLYPKEEKENIPPQPQLTIAPTTAPTTTTTSNSIDKIIELGCLMMVGNLMQQFGNAAPPSQSTQQALMPPVPSIIAPSTLPQPATNPAAYAPVHTQNNSVANQRVNPLAANLNLPNINDGINGLVKECVNKMICKDKK